MDKLLNYTPFHFLVGLVLGIWFQYFTQVWRYEFDRLVFLFVGFLVVLFILHIRDQKITFTIVSWLFFVFIGMCSVYIKDTRNYKNYYEYITTENSVATIIIKKVLKPSKYYDKYEAEVVQINTQKACGNILLNIQADSLRKRLQIAKKIFITTNFIAVNPPLNPHQFSYQEYLARQGIYRQLFLKSSEFKIIEKDDFPFLGLIAVFRTSVQNALKKYRFSKDELGVINALLLGQRTTLSKELLQNYSRAGAIHILAVSGLHVGIILLLLQWILKPLSRLTHGNFVKTVIIIVLLWCFACIAGLSASVVRAVTMFTFVAIGQGLNRRNSVEHSLITSMFFLLLVNPMFLFDVGFQLSYLAVFGIVWGQPKFYNLWSPRLKLIDKLWKLFTVSIGAQIGILPISLYYFHQFPSLFILSNLLIVPFLGVILMTGILIIILALFHCLPQELASVYGEVISIMNNFVIWISNQEDFVFQRISMSLGLMLVWYVVIVLGFRFVFIKRKVNQLIYLLIAIVGLQAVRVFEKYKSQTTKEFIVFHKSRNTVLGNREGESLQVFSNMDSVNAKQQHLITSYLVGERVSVSVEKNKSNIFKYNDSLILVVDSLGVFNVQGVQSSLVLLQNSPKINLNRLIDEVQPTKIIADGTNYKSYINRWKETCEKQKTPFHYTGEDGAFILSN